MYKDGVLSVDVDADLFDTWYIQKLTAGSKTTYLVDGLTQ
jgi:hypothetical protein